MHESFERFKAAGLIYEIQGDTELGIFRRVRWQRLRWISSFSAVEGEMTAHFVEESALSEAGARVLGVLAESQRACLDVTVELVVVKNYSNIYGVFAMLIILAIWTYAAWVIILLGVEVSNAFQPLGQR